MARCSKIFFLALTILCIGFVLYPKSHVLAKAPENNIIVKFTVPKNTFQVAKLFNLAVSQIKEIPRLNIFIIKNVTSPQEEHLYQEKSIFQEIKYIESDYRYQAFTTPNDTQYTSQWALAKISAPSAWDITTGLNSTKIAIVDTGVNGLHEDLAGKVLAGYDFVNNLSIAANIDSDDYGHGTAVASVAAALTNNSKGVAGLSWQSEIMPVKVLDADGYGYSSDIAAGIIYAADNGAKIINLSLGGQYPSTAIEDAVNYAYNIKGVFVAAAAGNENGSISYPARYASVFAVGATNESDGRCTPTDWGGSYGSNYGPEIDAVAPGNNILTASDYSISSYASHDGTSLASPYVGGLAALIWSINPTYSNAQITSRIKSNTDKVAGMGSNAFTDDYGYGRINARKSLAGGDNHSAQYSSQNAAEIPGLYDVALGPGETRTLWVKFSNNGDSIWSKGGSNPIHLGTSSPDDRTSVFIGSNRAANLVEDQVVPGEIGTFQFTITAPSEPGLYYEHFEPVTEGIRWLEVDMHWKIYVAASNAQYITQNTAEHPGVYDVAFGPGETRTLWVRLRNTGDATWFKNGAYPVHLGTYSPQDRNSIFFANQNLRANLVEGEVIPGNEGTFSFNITAPAQPGLYYEHFRPVMEGVSWFGPDIHWKIEVR